MILLVAWVNGAICGSSYAAGARRAAPLRPKSCDDGRISTKPFEISDERIEVGGGGDWICSGGRSKPRPYEDAWVNGAIWEFLHHGARRLLGNREALTGAPTAGGLRARWDVNEDISDLKFRR